MSTPTKSSPSKLVLPDSRYRCSSYVANRWCGWRNIFIISELVLQLLGHVAVLATPVGHRWLRIPHLLHTRRVGIRSAVLPSMKSSPVKRSSMPCFSFLVHSDARNEEEEITRSSSILEIDTRALTTRISEGRFYVSCRFTSIIGTCSSLEDRSFADCFLRVHIVVGFSSSKFTFRVLVQFPQG